MSTKRNKSTRRVSKSEFERLSTFRYSLRQFLRFSEDAARTVGLTPQQHQALLSVMGSPGRSRATLGELAERLQIRHHSAVGLVNRLETQGLVKREQAKEDRRQVHVLLTQQGVELLERLSTVHREEIRRIGPQLQLLLDQLSGSDVVAEDR